MSGFLYFRPGQTRNVTREDVTEWGLAYAFERSPLSCMCMANTPTGGAGVVFADPSRQGEGRVKMDLAAQEWRKMPRAGLPEIYCGYWRDAAPTPQDLARAKQLPGYSIPLADGHQWTIPVVRLFDEFAGHLTSNLPCYLDVDEQGRPVNGQPLSAYAHLWELTAPFAEQMLAEDSKESTTEQIADAACALLQTNYVVDWPEIAAAKALTNQQMIHNIVAVAIDWPTYLRWQEVVKKKTPSLAIDAG